MHMYIYIYVCTYIYVYMSDYPGRHLLSHPPPGSPSRSSVGGSRGSSVATSPKITHAPSVGYIYPSVLPKSYCIIYIYTCIYLYLYIYILIYIYIHVCICVNIYICVCRTTPDGTSSRTLHLDLHPGVLWGVRTAHPQPLLRKSHMPHLSGTCTLLYYMYPIVFYIHYMSTYIYIYIYIYTYIHLHIYDVKLRFHASHTHYMYIRALSIPECCGGFARLIRGHVSKNHACPIRRVHAPYSPWKQPRGQILGQSPQITPLGSGI